jgi:hypothetical protein
MALASIKSMRLFMIETLLWKAWKNPGSTVGDLVVALACSASRGILAGVLSK